MSRHTAETARDALFNRPAYVQETYAAGDPDGLSSAVLGHLQRLAVAVPAAEVSSWDARRAEIVADYGRMPGPTDKPFAYSDGVAVIPIHGLLLNRFSYSWGFVTGYSFIRNQLNAALIDPDVTLIAFDVNSQGGMCAGCQELSEEIFNSREIKPTIAVVDANCYSAAYFVASAASRVVVTPSSGIGSIGVLCMRVDLTKALEDSGIKVTVVYAGKNKLDSNPFVPFSADAQARLQASVDASYDAFVAAVARNRGLDEQAVRDTEATCYGPEEALALGLIDSIQPPAAALEAAVAELCNPDDGEDDDPMSTTRTPEQTAADAQAAAVTAAQAEARTAERSRIAAIQGHADAAGKPKLAAHLALSTSMSVDEAAAVLKAAAPEAAPVATTTTTTEKNPLEEAMAASRQPNVTGESGSETKADENTPTFKANRILAAQARATGSKVLTVQ